MRLTRLYYIRDIIEAFRAILFEPYLCECIDNKLFKYVDTSIRKIIIEWDAYRIGAPSSFHL